MEIKQNQGFSSFDFFTLVISLVVIGVITTPIVLRNMDSISFDKAQRDMQEISQFLLLPRTTSDLGRSIASTDPAAADLKPLAVSNLSRLIRSQGSEGDVAKDPWGNPYHFAIVKNLNGAPVYVVVWSDGPDGQSQTKIKGQLTTVASGNYHVDFRGDDLGTVVPVR